jgi:hypothetical protein
MSQLILACAKTGRAFKSGFRVHGDDLRFMPLKWTAPFLCGICRHIHDFEFAQARLSDCPDRCPHNGACHLCELTQRLSCLTEANVRPTADLMRSIKTVPQR